MICRISSVVLLLVLMPAATQGQTRYELKPKFAIGQRWSEQRTTTFDMTTSVLVQQQVVEQNRQTSRETYDLKWEVLSLTDETPTAARVSFGARCGGEIQQNGQTQGMPFPRGRHDG